MKCPEYQNECPDHEWCMTGYPCLPAQQAAGAAALMESKKELFRSRLAGLKAESQSTEPSKNT
jgi:hypothetical protein